jgi:UDP-4-amino-4,6-dideoxy-N-acetyl-beta-L-altrosamine transaminase
MSSERLPYGRQSIDDADIAEVVATLRGDWLTQGPRVQAFEAGLCEATGARYAVAVTNGTVALHLASQALGVRPGTVSLVPAVTFLSSAHGIRYCGGDVDFVDVEADTGLLDVEALSARVDVLKAEGRAPKLIVPVDLTGQPVDRAAVRRIADRCGARVLLDAAHSLGAVYRGSRLGEGGFADATILSFHPVKHITTAEGGAVLTDDPTLAASLASLRTFGMHKDPAHFRRDPADPRVGPWYYETGVLGWNDRLSDLHCALGLSQLRKLPAFLSRRRALAARYDAALRGVPGIAPPRCFDDRDSAWHLYVIRVGGGDRDEIALRRRDLFRFLAERAIHAQVHYVPVPWQPYYRALYPSTDLDWPGADAYYAGCLSLPLYPDLSDAQQDRVIDALATWAGR